LAQKMKKNMLTIFCVEKIKREHYALKSFLQAFLSKSKSPFEKWTKKMSKNENPKYFLVKMLAFTSLTENISTEIAIMILLS